MATVIKKELDTEEDVKVDIKEEVLLSDQIVLLDFQDCVMKRGSSIKCERVDLQDDSQPQASCNDQFRRHTEGTVEPHEGRVEHDYVIKHEVLDCSVMPVKNEPIDLHNDYQSQALCNGHLVTHTEDSKEQYTCKPVFAAESEDENTEVRKEQLKRAALKSKLRVCVTRLEAQLLTRYYSEQRCRENWPCVRYSCDVGKGTFSHKSTLRQHCQGCQCDTVEGRRIERRGAYECGVCGMAFLRKRRLNDHVFAHTGERPYQCSLCRKSFVYERTLNLHKLKHLSLHSTVCQKEFSEHSNLKPYMVTHTGKRPHKCTVCQKAFSQEKSLKSHLRTHTGGRPHKCSVCQEAFSLSANLKRHMRTHTGERSHKCTECHKAFSERGSLKRHMRTHTGERPHKCSVCQKTFSESGALKSHMVSHTGESPYKCTVCQKVFSLSGHLKRHMRTHTGERPQKCCVCQKAFSEKFDLKRHMRTHTGERPHQCTVCQKAFSLNGDLKRHMRTHTGERPHQYCMSESVFINWLSQASYAN